MHVFANDADAQQLNAMACHYDSKRHGFILEVVGIAPLPPQIGLRLGVVAHGYRSSLDNLAWALVRRGESPPDGLTDREQKASYFPIFDSRESFNACLKPMRKRPAMLPGVRRADAALVRRCQPYLHGKRNRPYHT